MTELRDPRCVGGGFTVQDGHVIIDTTNAVLLADMASVPYEDVARGETVLALSVRGRINRSSETASMLVLMDKQGAAKLIATVVAAAEGVSSQYAESLMTEMRTELAVMLSGGDDD